jgi:hypothetical protein
MGVGMETKIDPTQGVPSRDIALLSMILITDDWWEGNETALREWERAFRSDITNKSWGNVAALLLEYVWAALDNMRGTALSLNHEEENYHERTMSKKAMTTRMVLFGR